MSLCLYFSISLTSIRLYTRAWLTASRQFQTLDIDISFICLTYWTDWFDFHHSNVNFGADSDYFGFKVKKSFVFNHFRFYRKYFKWSYLLNYLADLVHFWYAEVCFKIVYDYVIDYSLHLLVNEERALPGTNILIY